MSTLYMKQVGIYIMAKIIRPQNDNCKNRMKNQKMHEKSEMKRKNLGIEYKYDESVNYRSKH